MDIQKKKKTLMQKQQYELQNQQLKEMLEIVKSQEDKEKIKELEAEQEMLQSMVEALSNKERTANDELVEARKAAIEVRLFPACKDFIIRVEIKPWILTCIPSVFFCFFVFLGLVYPPFLAIFNAPFELHP